MTVAAIAVTEPVTTSSKWYILLLITMIGTAFGFWFAQQQLLSVSPDALLTYPKFYILLTVFKCLLTILIFFAVSCLVLIHLSRQKLDPRWIAYSFLPLLLTFAKCPLAIILGLISTLQLSSLMLVWQRKDYTWLLTKYGVDLGALFVLFMLHLMLTSLYSPLHWHQALFTKAGEVSEEIPIQAPIYKGYSLAKQYSFSTMDYSEWASVLNPPVTLASPLSQLLTLTFDLPSINPVAYHRLFSAINFLLIIAGSFGCYLFLRYAAKLSPVFAFLGGSLMFFGASRFMFLMVSYDGAIFMSSYATFPYCLLLLSLACEKRSYALAAWTGVALASQFFILTPHPEGIVYTGFFLGVYGIGLILFSPFASLKQRFLLTSFAFVNFLLLSAYVVTPMLVDEITGVAHTFAHTDLNVNSTEYLQRFEILFTVFIPLSLLLLSNRRQLYPAFLPALFFCVCMATLYAATTKLSFISALVNTLHVGLHIWVPWRIGLFVCLSIIIVTVICLEALTSKALQFIIFLARD